MSTYVVTGATGFIGRFLVSRLLDRGGTVHAIVREPSLDKFAAMAEQWSESERVHAVIGDLTEPALGVVETDLKRLRRSKPHVFHLAAIYDVTASADDQYAANVQGTRHALEFAEAVNARCFHHVSSIAAGGLYDGVFTEDMFDEATDLDVNPYFRTKHDAEGLVRNECAVPWRVYRPGIVVGHSETGEIDKVDGPYYFFSALRRLRDTIPSWTPWIGPSLDQINIVPVDFVADAIDHIAHVDGMDDKVFHLTDPEPLTLGETLNEFCNAAGAPDMVGRVDAHLSTDLLASGRRIGGAIPGATTGLKAALGLLGVPAEVLSYLAWPTTYDRTNTDEALAGTDIAVPPLAEYADTLWNYWEATFAPTSSDQRRLRKAIEGKVVLITGASSGIGKDVAMKVGTAGGIVALVARTPSKLETTRAQIELLGGTAHVHPADLSDLDDVDRVCAEILDTHGRVDVVVNNAGRSIRRSVERSYDRFHDFERTMQLNYFGAVRIILNVLPSMRERGDGHIINVSSIGVQTNPPRFGAYVASKAALDAFSRCIASEIRDDNVRITTVHMPLVRTPMIAPTSIYKAFPTRSPYEAGSLIVNAMVRRPKRVATGIGNLGELMYAVSPTSVDAVLNRAYHLFPDSKAARGDDAGAGETDETDPDRRENRLLTTGARLFARATRGIHW